MFFHLATPAADIAKPKLRVASPHVPGVRMKAPTTPTPRLLLVRDTGHRSHASRHSTIPPRRRRRRHTSRNAMH
ncbi:hypothetical protein O3P69_006556 [Scylla paramamosain]|uniref:Uncharacterized protein n=1 Tax=Scylla paramamosain TaxID=85552 RepID=A0AAW0U305_SCYPA